MASPKGRRSIKTEQIDSRLLQLEASSLGAAGAVSGLDSKSIKEVIYNGVGDLTVIFKKPFSPTNQVKPKAILSMVEADTAAHMYASDYDRVSIRITDLAGVAKEGSVSMMIMGTNHRFIY